MAQLDDAELRPGLALYRPLPTMLRLDVLPFGMLYATFSACAAVAQRGHGFAVGLALVACTHALTFFASEWSLRVKCFVAYSRISIAGLSTYDDVVVKVEPTLPSLPAELCPIRREAPSPKLQVQKATIPVPTLWFSYQKLRFCLDTSMTAPVCFRRLTYPINKDLAAYAGANGYTSRVALEAAGLRWQKNEFEIPMPAFWTLLKQHLVAPFFVFQFFCMLLWCMDEYMYYSLLTMAMLVLFECTVVKQRQHNLELLALMQRPPTRVYAYRMTKWQRLSSTDLVPGDLVSIGRATAFDETDESGLVAPCDLLLLRGACVVNEAMLSGESIPLRKEHVDPLESSALLLNGRHRKHVLFGGTKILQHTPYAPSASDSLPAPPDHGCVAFVLRTGFGTTQGDMLRTILLASPHLSANNTESLCFILFLVCFALAASLYVLLEGAGDPTRSSYKLFLHCVMIITSVVPPELPMELSLAVTNSLLSLSRMDVFCTEPFKIPVAGKVDVVCVDKTGTLTTDALALRGVAGLSASSLLPLSDPRTLVSPGALPMDVQIVLASCHALIVLNGAIAGDPLEKTVLAHLHDWTLHQLDRVTSRYPFSVRSLRIIHRFGFSSELRRMSALVLVDDGSAIGHARVVCKGAPEVMEPLFAHVPSYYRDVHEHYARKGARVLALGFKRVPISDLARTRHLARDATETNLTFAGFLVLDCPLKPDSRRVVQDLQLANHRVVMVTGDSALTASDVARQVHLLPHAETLVLEPSTSGLLFWTNATSATEKYPFTEATLATLAETHNFCVLGSAVASLSPPLLQALAPLTQVFARTSPDEKALVLAALNAGRNITAMCGDGTNDVGALKRAHVGISLVNGPTRHHPRDAPPLGDASMASPFTSRGESLQCVVDVIRQGRCTLVTSLQMYKILGVNCLVSAYVLSALYVYGVKQGDTQLTCSGLLLALCFLFLSYAKPASTLSHERPASRVFCVSVLSSILLQFGVHLCSLVLGLSIAAPLVEWNDPRLHADASFTPNALNTLMFLLATCMQVTTFVANYKGRPFMESFREHKLLARCAYASYGFVLVALLELWPAMNTWLELVPLGSDMVQGQVLCLMLFDTVAVLALERTVQVLTTAYPEWMT